MQSGERSTLDHRKCCCTKARFPPPIYEEYKYMIAYTPAKARREGSPISFPFPAVSSKKSPLVPPAVHVMTSPPLRQHLRRQRRPFIFRVSERAGYTHARARERQGGGGGRDDYGGNISLASFFFPGLYLNKTHSGDARPTFPHCRVFFCFVPKPVTIAVGSCQGT